MLRTLFAVALLASAVAVHGQDAAELFGTIQGRNYVSPTGAFKVAIPVMPELGGDITDTPNVVTFQDDFNVHVSIAAFPQDATQRWELSTRGPKEYLSYFFMNMVLPDFKRSFQGVEIENATFNPKTFDGALTVFLLIPGGSMFMDRVMLMPNDAPPVAKRGNLVFVKSGFIFVISTELAERVTQGTAYKKTKAEEEQILRQRLEDIVNKMQFVKPPETKPAIAPQPSVPPKK